MAGFGAIGILQTVVGSLIDQRAIVLYEQPTAKEIESKIKGLGDIGELAVTKAREKLNKPVELFLGITIPFLSEINGFNMYGISYIDVDVDITSDLCEHPIETGGLITDNAIINPVSAKVRVALPTLFYTRIYKAMEDYFLNKKLIQMQTKLALYKNMVLQSMPHKIGTDNVDRPIIELDLRQVIEVIPQMIGNGKGSKGTKNASDADTKNAGRKYSDSLEFISPENDLANQLTTDPNQLQLNGGASGSWFDGLFGKSSGTSLNGLAGLI